jgi:hypothetical protein
MALAQKRMAGRGRKLRLHIDADPGQRPTSNSDQAQMSALGH